MHDPKAMGDPKPGLCRCHVCVAASKAANAPRAHLNVLGFDAIVDNGPHRGTIKRSHRAEGRNFVD